MGILRAINIAVYVIRIIKLVFGTSYMYSLNDTAGEQ